MLTRIFCDACRVSGLWTDDPQEFLQTVCSHYRQCSAELFLECARERGTLAKRRPGLRHRPWHSRPASLEAAPPGLRPLARNGEPRS